MADDVGEAVRAFFSLEGADWRALLDLNRRIREHRGPWGHWERPPHLLLHPDQLVSEFVQFWYAKKLIVVFEWGAWQEGRDWYRSADAGKYAALDVPTALKLLTAVIRNDRFNEGALVSAFESGDFPKILNRMVAIREGA